MEKIQGVNHRRAVRALKKAGFRVAREGKHIVMTDGVRILTIPRHNPKLLNRERLRRFTEKRTVCARWFMRTV